MATTSSLSPFDPSMTIVHVLTPIVGPPAGLHSLPVELLEHICLHLDLDDPETSGWFGEQEIMILGARSKLHMWQDNTRFNLSRTSHWFRQHYWLEWLAKTSFVFTARPGHFGHFAATEILFPNDHASDIKPVDELLHDQLQGLYKLTPSPETHIKKVRSALPDCNVNFDVGEGGTQMCWVRGHAPLWDQVRSAVQQYAVQDQKVDWSLVMRLVCFMVAASSDGFYFSDRTPQLRLFEDRLLEIVAANQSE